MSKNRSYIYFRSFLKCFKTEILVCVEKDRRTGLDRLA